MVEKHGNKENYMVSIIGEQILDGDSDRVEVITAGNYVHKGDRCFIGYKEYDEDNPNRHFNNIIKVEKNLVTINRTGPLSSRLMLEKGRRHQCVYKTPAGDLMIGVYTKTLDNNLSEKGGRLEVSYTLDFNSDLVSENRFIITVEEKNTEV